MERLKINVEVRERIGKEGAKKYRRAGEVPGIIYGKGINMSIKVTPVSLKALKAINFSPSTILDVEVTGAKSDNKFSALIKNVQYHPLSEDAIHLDFLKVNLEEKIRVRVPVFLKGEAKGVKDGGIVQHLLHNIEVEGYPLDIPQKLELDITELAMGFSFHVADVKVSDKLRIITGSQETVVAIVSKTEEVVAATPEEGAPTGPEVIKEKKEGEEGEEGAEEGKEEPAKEKGKEEPAKEKGKEAPAKEKGKEAPKEKGKEKK